MTPAELAAHLVEALGPDVREEITPQGQIAIWVPPEKWVQAGVHLKECPKCWFDFFTFLAGVDQEDQGIEIVAHVWSVRRMHALNMKVLVPREHPHLPSLSGVWRGANWHERETFELFGVHFDGHPHMVKLLLPEPFEGHPLRKEFLLMTREAKEWPGAKEPEERKA
jgi:NADH-quinone oxidoreductase subunit C